MTTVTKAANAHTAVTTGWTNPSSAFATTGDNVYATAVPGKNATVNGDFGFPAFTTSDIPDGSLIESVDITVEWGMTAAVTGGILGCFGRNNTSGVQYGPETTKTTTTEAQATIHCQGVTLTDLRTANLFRARIRCGKGNTTTAMTGNLDFVSVTVTYTAPPTTIVPVAATELRGTGNSAFGPVSAVAGNALFVGGYGYGGTSFTVTRAGDTYTTDTNGTVSAAAILGIASAPNVAGGSVTLTVSSTSASPTQAWVAEFSGIDTSSILDSSPPALATGTSASATSNSETNVSADALFLAFMGCTATPDPSLVDIEPGWVDVIGDEWMATANGATDLVSGFAFKVVSASAADAADWTITSSGWGVLVAAYKAAPTGGGGTTLTPAAIAIPITVVQPTLVLTVAPAAIAIPIAQPAHSTLAIEAPAAIPIPIAVVAPSLAMALVPTPVMIPAVVATQTTVVTETPTPIAIPLVVPTPAITSGATLAPAPIAIPITVAQPTLVLTIATAPVAVPIVVAAPALALNVAPAAVTIPLAVAAPSLALVRAVAPVTIPISVAAATLTVRVTPAPVTVPLVIPTATLVTGGLVLVAPIAIPLVVPQPTVLLVRTVQPVAIPLVVPTATISTATIIAPAAVPVTIAVPPPTLTVSLPMAPVTVPVVVVTSTLVAAIRPSSVTMPLVVVTPNVDLSAFAPITLFPSPVAIPIIVLSPSTIVSILNYVSCEGDMDLPDVVYWPQGVERATGEETAAELRGCQVPVDVLRPWEI